MRRCSKTHENCRPPPSPGVPRLQQRLPALAESWAFQAAPHLQAKESPPQANSYFSRKPAYYLPRLRMEDDRPHNPTVSNLRHRDCVDYLETLSRLVPRSRLVSGHASTRARCGSLPGHADHAKKNPGRGFAATPGLSGTTARKPRPGARAGRPARRRPASVRPR